MLTVVSTASEVGMLRYGNRFLESFAQHWPADIRLLFYVDNAMVAAEIAVKTDRAELHSLSEAAWLGAFKHDHRYNPKANGYGGYRWDAIRFAHKVAAIIDADLLCQHDHLLWLDADIVTHNHVDHTAIASWLPGDDVWLSWLDRDPSVIGWPECGFLLFNCNYQRHAMAMRTLLDAYTLGYVLELPETHDSYVWKWLVERLVMPVRDLSGDGFKTMHPLINSPLGHWFDHLKGSRKLAGHSYPSDLVVARTEPYWNNK